MFEAALSLSKKLAQKLFMSAEPYFIDIFYINRFGVDCRNLYLTIERG